MKPSSPTPPLALPAPPAVLALPRPGSSQPPEARAHRHRGAAAG